MDKDLISNQNIKQKGQWIDFVNLLKIGNPSKIIVAFAIVLSLFETITSLFVPLLTKNLIDQIASHGIDWTFIFLLICAFIIQTIAGGFSYYLLTYIGENFVLKIREKLWTHVLDLPISFFDKHQSGEIMSRIIQDTNTVKMLIVNHLVTFISGIVSIIGAIIILFIIDWKMTLIMLISVPLALLIIMPLGRKIYQISMDTQDEMASLSANLGRVLADIRLVKSYNGHIVENRKGKQGIQELFRYGLKEAKIQAVISPFMTTILMLVLVILIGYGGARVAAGLLTAGSLVAIIIYMFQIVVPFTQMASFYTSFQKAMGATERIQEILHIEKENSRKGEKPNNGAQLIFRNVTFAYEEGKDVLKNISFRADPDKTIAFVGPSGSGKTTIFSLIERFYQPQKGEILYGNIPIDSIDLEKWREIIGYVSQESPIMSGTIKDNICYGLTKEVTFEEIQEAAKLANAHEFIIKLPKGYDSEVGERGVMLSGGQRQRIAIARAILRNPKILLLDEATSNLDSESEWLVQDALKNLMSGRTTLIIAHRLSTVFDADSIIVLENGEITGIGTHEELLGSHPLYQKLVQQQMKTTEVE